MRRRRISSSDGGGNWMDTYGDMVTLLLTFFVMLYSMSSLNQQKWEIFVKSIIPNAGVETEDEQIAINEPIDAGKYDVEGSMDTEVEPPSDVTLDTLYLALAQEMNEAGVSGVTLSRGEGYTFVAFKDQSFFAGDSSVLTDQAKAVLDIFCQVIQPESEEIRQIEVLGYTSQGDPDRPNNPRTDRLLSAMRSAEVTAYIQEKNVIAPEKLVGISYGQFRPVDTFETSEGRAANRRVELMILDEGADLKSFNDYYNDYNSGANAETTIETTGNAFVQVDGKAEDMASQLPQENAQDAANETTQ